MNKPGLPNGNPICVTEILQKSGVVLEPGDAFFRNREQEFAVANDARGRVVHLRIVDPQCQHDFPLACFSNSGAKPEPARNTGLIIGLAAT